MYNWNLNAIYRPLILKVYILARPIRVRHLEMCGPPIEVAQQSHHPRGDSVTAPLKIRFECTLPSYEGRGSRPIDKRALPPCKWAVHT